MRDRWIQRFQTNPTIIHPAFLRQDGGGGSGGGGTATLDRPAANTDAADSADRSNDSDDRNDDADDDDDDDEPLGSAGRRALKRERRAAREAQRERDQAARDLATARAELERLQTADMDETQRQLRRLPELETAVTTLTSENERLTATLTQERQDRAIEREASRDETRFNDPADALAFIDRSEIEIDEDGKVKPSSVRRELKRILTEKPYLATGGHEAPPAEETPAAPAADRRGDAADTDSADKERSASRWRRRA